MADRPARWLFPRIDEARASSLAAELGVSTLLARILVKREIADAGQAHEFLNPTFAGMHDPYRMKGMRAAAGRLAEAVRRKEKVLLYGDYDVDGTSSIVILKKALELAGLQADFHVPHRLNDGYGMKAEVIEQAAANGVRLIVSVDTGIRAGEVVRQASRLGIDVIVTDHHLPEEELPPALAVLNPNQPDCPYPEKNLCGAGVALKLMQALLREFEVPPARAERLILSFLKMAAIATVADVVSLTGENRAIVRLGLADLAGTTNVGLRALLDVAGFRPGDRPTAGQVAFRIAPRINAAGRMASARDVIELFLTSDNDRARTIASSLHDLNRERQDAEANMLREAMDMAASENWIHDDMRALVFFADGWHRGVAGIVASRLVERFHRPVFVLGMDEAKGEAQGSGRSIPPFHLVDALESMPDLFSRFGGHKQAAGLAIRPDRVDEFRRRFNEYACLKLSADDLRAHHDVDVEARLPELTAEAVRELSKLEPFGFGNPSPSFAVRSAQLAQTASIMKEKHLRFKLEQSGASLICKAWNWADRAGRLPARQNLDFLLSVGEDEYCGWSGTLKDVRPAE